MEEQAAILNKVVIDFLENNPGAQIYRHKGVSHVSIWQYSVPGRGNHLSQGPEVRTCPVF